MKIALIGYGKMGKAIEEIALQKGHTVTLKINSQNKDTLTAGHLSNADVAIEFSNPESAVSNIYQCLDAGLPVVCGSTGWLEALPELEAYCRKKNGTFIYASNYSVGVNIFFELNNKLAVLMASQPDYEVQIEEIHHTQKKDSPSGTAISLGEQIIDALPGKSKWVNEPSDITGELSIISRRIDPAPGTHTVLYHSAVDDIEIRHTAHNRKGFAAGALLAAEFIAKKKGIFTMKDVLGF